MMWKSLFFLFLQSYVILTNSECVCTTVPCPTEGNNHVIMGNGSADMNYIYKLHNNYEVVVSASGTITPNSLDNGSGTTSCTQQYSRVLEDDGEDNCDAGHILANRLGGYGNIPINIFPQNSSINRGTYAQFEGDIYDCIKMRRYHLVILPLRSLMGPSNRFQSQSLLLPIPSFQKSHLFCRHR